MSKGILKLEVGQHQMVFYTEEGFQTYKDLQSFLDSKQEGRYCQVYMAKNEMNAIYRYLKQNCKESYYVKSFTVSPKVPKVIGFSYFKEGKTAAIKTFYDIKYKIGSNEFTVGEALERIKKSGARSSSFTGWLRENLQWDKSEVFIRETKTILPSMCPIVYTKLRQPFENVFCYDIKSAHPYHLTQPLPHKGKILNKFKKEMLNNDGFAYYGQLIIYNIKAKHKGYYPLTFRNQGQETKTPKPVIKGINVKCDKARIISGDRVVINGFIKDLVEILDRNYTYSYWEVPYKVVQYELRVDEKLRAEVFKYFKKKESKENNKGEKVVLNRLYGFFITKGLQTPAHYGWYVVSKQRIIIDRMINKIGLENVVQSHTDSIKFIGEENVKFIEEYNEGIEFNKLGNFCFEDKFQKCYYFSNIVGKYINQKGKLDFKHGGINKMGIANLYRLKYDKINEDTKIFIISDWVYCDEIGYIPVIKESTMGGVGFEN